MQSLVNLIQNHRVKCKVCKLNIHSLNVGARTSYSPKPGPTSKSKMLKRLHMEVLIGHPLLLEASGPVVYKRESVPTNLLTGKLLDFALACVNSNFESAKLEFNLSGTIEQVKVLNKQGSYESWNPSSDPNLALSLLEEGSFSDDISWEVLTCKLRELVAKTEGESFHFDRPIKKSPRGNIA